MVDLCCNESWFCMSVYINSSTLVKPIPGSSSRSTSWRSLKFSIDMKWSSQAFSHNVYIQWRKKRMCCEGVCGIAILINISSRLSARVLLLVTVILLPFSSEWLLQPCDIGQLQLQQADFAAVTCTRLNKFERKFRIVRMTLTVCTKRTEHLYESHFTYISY